MTLRHVDLCSGIGGFSLGFEWAGLSQPILFCDTEKWCRQILHQHWPDVPITEDVKELANDPDTIPDCDILTAGYPCQPFSLTGKRKGTKDDRHIWPYIRKIVAHKRPSWVVFENVYGHISLGLDEVLSDLEHEGYTSRTFVVPAASVDAPHKRNRVWIVGRSRDVADTDSLDRGSVQEPRQRQQKSAEFGQSTGNSSSHVANPSSEGPQGWVHRGTNTKRQGVDGYTGCSSPIHRQPTQDWWATEPSVGRVAHGIPRRMDRLKGLGNAIVPQIAMQIGLTIKKQIEKDKDEQ